MSTRPEVDFATWQVRLSSCDGHLDASNENIGDTGVRALSAALGPKLKLSTPLTTLVLRENRIGDAGVKNLVDALAKLPSVTILDLTGNEITDNGVGELGDLLACGGLSLRRLNMEDNKLTPPGIKALAKALRKNKGLTYLSLNGNTVGGSAKAVAELLKGGPPLKVLYLERCEVDGDGLCAIGSALERNKTLTELYLALNPIGDGGVKDFAEALEQNQSVRFLHIGECEIYADGACSIAKMLARNRTLLEVWLDGNFVDDNAAAELAKALRTNESLAELSLANNRITSTGAIALADALAANISLISLDLGQNRIGDVGAEAFADAVRRNRTLRNLLLTQNEIDDSGAKALLRAIDADSSLERLDLHFNPGYAKVREKLNKMLLGRVRQRANDAAGPDPQDRGRLIDHTDPTGSAGAGREIRAASNPAPVPAATTAAEAPLPAADGSDFFAPVKKRMPEPATLDGDDPDEIAVKRRRREELDYLAEAVRLYERLLDLKRQNKEEV
ncbi:hypothetical protein DFJ74DRAFT_429872 [Hyaloraphidium curvatum]|nr:hypothetical protein DFJ74DRAFT_429872 [Hyaloraphidium curvatum]